MSGHASVTIEEVRRTAVRLAAALQVEGEDDASGALREAADVVAAPGERLLALRSALVRTRPQWSKLPDEGLVSGARAVVAGAKRLAIEL